MGTVTEDHPTTTYNGIEIDTDILDLIKSLHAINVPTYECCQGAHNDEWVADFGHHEYAFVIMLAADWPKAKHLFPNIAMVEAGAAGYWLAEYNENPPDDDECIYVHWDITKLEIK